MLGIHGRPLRAIPLFLVYLGVLFHTYSLAARISQAGSPSAAAGPAPVPTPGDLEAGPAQPRAARSPSSAALAEQAYLGEALGSSLSRSLQRVGLRLLEGCYLGERLLAVLAVKLQGRGPCWNTCQQAAARIAWTRPVAAP